MKFIVPKALKPAQQGETPAKVRQAETQLRLKKAGGKRQAFNLTAEALKDIQTIKAKRALVEDDTAAVIAALHYYARAK